MTKCKWCDKIEAKGLRFECFWIDEEGRTASFIDKEARLIAGCIAKYCPMCGRELREEDNHE